MMDTGQAMLEWLEEHPEGATTRQLADAIGVSVTKASKRAQTLAAMGKMVRHGANTLGCWSSVSHAEHAAAALEVIRAANAEATRQKELARGRAIREFSTGPIVDRYESVYRRLLG